MKLVVGYIGDGYLYYNGGGGKVVASWTDSSGRVAAD
jgi:hypothetical protein